ncbi:zinc-binding dehydrogenase [Ruania zhangjianzhongii]|uniref:zinc-binding dehydrogenase n=1 Tax=Ruania zhangjianzhongii TaxID=2603206 RepID=UPI0011C9DA15|nr:zinc-binding dehydrogenase [Ruania zhangjianzhongii]
MRALVINGKEDLSLAEVPVPEPGPGQVRIRTAYVGICGSDLHYYYDGANGAFVVREPLIPGHEMSGTVDADPSGELAPGTAVTVHPATFGDEQPGLAQAPHLWPNGAYLGSASTWPHTQGAAAEYFVVDASMVRVLPAGLPLNRAALAEPLAVGLHGIALAGGVAGQRVLVTGSGAIGLLAAGAAVALGAAEVTTTDVLEGPLGRARGLGAAQTINVRSEEIPAEAYDVVLECSGIPASINAAFVAARRAGTYVQVGMVPNAASGINLAPMISKELTMHGSFRFNNEIDAAISLLAERPEIEQVITHTFDAADAVQGFATAKDSEASGKVLLALPADPDTA